MDSWTCMNVMCGAKLSSSVECKRGWILRSGEYACLCHCCWSAYEQSIFCDFFHSKESGWRECTSCGKRLHCGCIASSCLLELLDIGGVKCSSCSKSLGHHTITNEEKPDEFTMANNIAELQTSVIDNQTYGESADNMELMACGSDGNGFRDSLSLQNDGIYGRVGQIEQDEATTGSEKLDTECPSSSNKVSTSYQHTKLETFKTFGVEPAKGFITERNLSIALGDPSGNLNHFPSSAVDERAHSKTYSSIPQGPQSLRIFPKTPKSALASELNSGTENIQHLRVARPPAEGRGRNQLLPRYWPRITDQELQQISGDSNCKVVPLFEKILSASDAGRIGRLVLPKACAEAYFPPISQPEGIPLKIQDVKGNEWVFQFRFWPNNNSRMYVLEGVTPCIQSMQLQAGDTVTFSRMDPEEKLIMGFRKASNSVPKQSLTGSTNPQISAITQYLISGCDDFRWENTQMDGNTAIEGLMQQAMLVPENNNTRNIGGKSKRLLIDSLDALELKLTWEEVHDMLQPPSSVRPSVVSVDDHEFEEYEEPPVLGKRSIFIIRTSGRQEQWVQCDDCFKWRRLPVDLVVPSRWTCAENSWDPNRCSCSARDELTPCELENLLIQNKDFRKWKLATNHGSILENESSRFDAAVSGDPESSIAATTKHPRHRPGCSCIVCIQPPSGKVSGDPESSIAATTKHPRHRPGCSCIVCIQPPSGKGKHNSTCNCNVCMTVKRRFKTLMMRKKKRQSDHEAEIAQRRTNLIDSPKDPSDNDSRQVNIESASETTRKGHIDLNAQSNRREEDSQVDLTTGLSMTSLVQYASLPLETYLKQNGLTSLISEKQTNSGGSHMLSQVIGDSEEHLNEERCLDSEID